MDAFKFLLPAVQKISDKLERAAVANDLAGYLGVEPGLVLEQFKRAATDRHAPGQVTARRARRPVTALLRRRPRCRCRCERILLNALLSSDRTREEILPRAAGGHDRQTS